MTTSCTDKQRSGARRLLTLRAAESFVSSERPLQSTNVLVAQLLSHRNRAMLRIIMPRPRRGGGSIRRSSASVVRPSVRLSVRLMSRTSALTRKPKGLGRRNFAQEYPRSHVTPTPTSRSKGQKSRSRGQLVQRSEMCQYFANA